MYIYVCVSGWRRYYVPNGKISNNAIICMYITIHITQSGMSDVSCDAADFSKTAVGRAQTPPPRGKRTPNMGGIQEECSNDIQDADTVRNTNNNSMIYLINRNITSSMHSQK